MSSRLKSKKLLKLTSLTTACLIAVVFAFFLIQKSVWTKYDYQALDGFYKTAVKKGYGPKKSSFPQIKYLTITDETYSYTHKNFLDRSFLAKANTALSELGVEAVAYDIIFPYPTNLASDTLFFESIRNLDCVYLPIGLRTANTPGNFAWKQDEAYKKFKTRLKKPVLKGESNPFHGISALMQYDTFAKAAFNSGHISSFTDEDGTSRHLLMVIKIEEKFFPTLSLSMFLDYAKIPFENIRIEWGKKIVITATPDSSLEKDVVIPIDDRGRAFIPYCNTWKKGFDEIPAHVLVEKMKDPNLRGNLTEIFEGNFIFIGDISLGISDLGKTPLQNDVPLIIIHTSMLNGMLTNQFYAKWSFGQILGLILVIGVLLGFSSFLRSSWILYITTAAILCTIILHTWFQFIHFTLFPIATVVGSTFFIASGLIITMEILISKDRNHIKTIFARYVPEKVVNHLLLHPDLLNLGGETREISIMMSDLRGFTSMAAEHSPKEVITILNRYFEVMVEIIMDHRGIIDEIIGDGILALFGAPEKLENHEQKAVACALAMQKAMMQININNAADGLPHLKMGIAINTGEVVVGNVGSLKRTKYGACGSEVNTTGRAESYTVGGQVLITDATYQRIKDVVQINRVMEVSMKGMTRKAKLYDVIGMSGEYNLFLDKGHDLPIQLQNTIRIKIYKLSEKIVTDTPINGCVTHLSPSTARLLLPEPFVEFENIKLHIDPEQLPKPDSFLENDEIEAYAKVLSCTQLKTEFEIMICFTSLSPKADEFFMGKT